MNFNKLPQRARAIVSTRRGPVALIILTAVGAVALTVVAYLLGVPLDPGTHVGAVFASWVGGVAIFVAGSAVIGLASLVPPESSAFDARARILFRGQSGEHIDYIIQKIREVFGQYSDETQRTISIHRVDEASGKLSVQVETSVKLRGYVDDIESIATSALTLNKLCQPPPGQPACRLSYVRINDDPIEIGEFAGEIDFKFPTKVPAGGHTKVDMRWECWVDNGESHTHAPVRYTRKFALRFENHCSKDLRLRYSVRGRPDSELTIKKGSRADLISEPDVNPQERVYDLRVEVI